VKLIWWSEPVERPVILDMDVREVAIHRSRSNMIGRFRGRLSCAPANRLPNMSAWMSNAANSEDR
jgi:hypothetical protein